MTLAIGQGIILSGKSYFHYIRNSSNFEDFEGFCYHYIGQILANITFHAYTWPKIEWTHVFTLGKKFLNVNISIWPIYEVMNVHLLKSIKYALKLEFWAHLRSWKMKIFYVFLAKCWPRWVFGVGQCWKIVRNDIWVLPNIKNYVRNMFWPRFGQKTLNFQLSNCFYRHAIYYLHITESPYYVLFVSP